MPKKTYTQINSTTLTTASSSITFSSIPQNFRDLIINISVFSAGSPVRATVIANGDSGNNYTLVYMDGNPNNTVASASETRANYSFAYSDVSASSSRPYNSALSIFDYSAFDKHKMAFLRGGNSNDRVVAYAQRWASSAAITSLTINATQGGNFLIGSTFTLYGIEA